MVRFGPFKNWLTAGDILYAKINEIQVQKFAKIANSRNFSVAKISCSTVLFCNRSLLTGGGTAVLPWPKPKLGLIKLIAITPVGSHVDCSNTAQKLLH